MLADRCVDVVDEAAAGIMLASADGELRLLTSSSEAVRVLELFEAQADEGPCVDCYRGCRPMGNVTPPRPMGGGSASRLMPACRLPVRARPSHAIAGPDHRRTDMFRVEEGGCEKFDLVAAQALADVATIVVLQHRAVVDSRQLNQQLTQVLNARIVRAKAVVAESAGLNMEDAFTLLRRHSRKNNASDLLVPRFRLAPHCKRLRNRRRSGSRLPAPSGSSRGSRDRPRSCGAAGARAP